MKEVKEIEIDSTFRNRQLYPLQTHFELPVNAFTERNQILTAVDPVSDAFPQFVFQAYNLNPVVANSTINGTVARVYGSRVIASFAALFETANFYKALSTANLEIQSYSFAGNDALGNDLGEFEIKNNSFIPGSPIQISWTPIQNFLTPGLKFLFVPAFNGQEFKYIYNERTDTSADIVSVSKHSSSVLFFLTDTSWMTTDRYSLRNALPLAVTQTILPSSGSTLFLPPLFPYHENAFVLLENQYVGKLKSVNTLGEATVIPNIDVVIPAASRVQILPYRENFQSLIYIGSQLSQIENKTYVAQLISLVIPNTVTKSGSRVSSFTYLYVEFLDTNCYPNQNIMSNNPHSNKIYFRVTPSRIQQIRDWLTFDSDGSSKTLRFRPTATNFRISVKTPNGHFLELPEDNKTPVPPDPTLQISLLLNIKPV